MENLFQLVIRKAKITKVAFYNIECKACDHGSLIMTVAMLCYVMLCYVMLCYVMLCYVMWLFV